MNPKILALIAGAQIAAVLAIRKNLVTLPDDQPYSGPGLVLLSGLLVARFMGKMGWLAAVGIAFLLAIPVTTWGAKADL